MGYFSPIMFVYIIRQPDIQDILYKNPENIIYNLIIFEKPENIIYNLVIFEKPENIIYNLIIFEKPENGCMVIRFHPRIDYFPKKKNIGLIFVIPKERLREHKLFNFYHIPTLARTHYTACHKKKKITKYDNCVFCITIILLQTGVLVGSQ